jgi:hypothetical protein
MNRGFAVFQFFWMHVILHVIVIEALHPLQFPVRTLDTNITNEFGYWLLSSCREVTAHAVAHL